MQQAIFDDWVSGKETIIMLRQCAWCLRLIDDAGTPLSSEPLPKDYEATHGMCQECGMRWLEAVLRSEEIMGLEDVSRAETSTLSRRCFK